MKDNPTLAAPDFLYDENNLHLNPEIVTNHSTKTWKSQKGEVLVVSMDSDYLQRAFEDVQYRELQLLKQLDETNLMKEHLLYEARRRKITLLWLDEVKKRTFGGIFKAERFLRKIIGYSIERDNWRRQYLKEFRARNNNEVHNQQERRTQVNS